MPSLDRQLITAARQGTLKAHSLRAELAVPPLDNDALVWLRESIESRGFDHDFPVVVVGDRVVDGMARATVAVQLFDHHGDSRYLPSFRQLAGGADVAAYIASVELARRHMTATQRIEVAVRMYRMLKAEKLRRPGQPARRALEALAKQPLTVGQIAKQAKLSPSMTSKVVAELCSARCATKGPTIRSKVQITPTGLAELALDPVPSKPMEWVLSKTGTSQSTLCKALRAADSSGKIPAKSVHAAARAKGQVRATQSLNVPADVHARLKAHAESMGVGIGELAADIITQWLATPWEDAA